MVFINSIDLVYSDNIFTEVFDFEVYKAAAADSNTCSLDQLAVNVLVNSSLLTCILSTYEVLNGDLAYAVKLLCALEVHLNNFISLFKGTVLFDLRGLEKALISS